MKKLLCLVLIIFPLITFAQKEQTTENEYLWVTKSFIRYLTEGADMKQGYEMQLQLKGEAFSDTWGNTSRFAVYKFVKQQNSQTKAIAFVYYLNNEVNKVLCMPAIVPSTLYGLFLQELQSLSNTEKSALIYSLSSIYLLDTGSK